MVENGRWLLLGDWNPHHSSWPLDGGSSLDRRVIKHYIDERGVEVEVGGDHTFMRSRRGSTIRSRIDFRVTGVE